MLVDEAVGRVVQQGAHHGLSKPGARRQFGVKPFGIREGEKKKVKEEERDLASFSELVLGGAAEWGKKTQAWPSVLLETPW